MNFILNKKNKICKKSSNRRLNIHGILRQASHHQS